MAFDLTFAEIMDRLLSIEMEIPWETFRRYKYHDIDNFESVKEYSKKILDAPFLIADNGECVLGDMDTMLWKFRQMMEHDGSDPFIEGPDLFYIDQLYGLNIAKPDGDYGVPDDLTPVFEEFRSISREYGVDILIEVQLECDCIGVDLGIFPESRPDPSQTRRDLCRESESRSWHNHVKDLAGITHVSREAMEACDQVWMLHRYLFDSSLEDDRDLAHLVMNDQNRDSCEIMNLGFAKNTLQMFPATI